jgi:glutaconate CoA-transferase subunit A
VRAITPDVALFHAAVADRDGNVWIGVRRELMTMAHAARRTLVTVERIVDENLLAEDRTAAGTIPSLYLDAVCVAPFGARPLGLRGCYGPDEAALRAYVAQARSAASALKEEA